MTVKEQKHCNGLNFDHIVPIRRGGLNNAKNLINTSSNSYCAKSNNHRGDNSRKDAVLDSQKAKLRLACRIGQYWLNFQYSGTPEENKWTFGSKRIASVCNFIDKLSDTEIFEAVDIAYEKIPQLDKSFDEARWRYFCGICWTKIRSKQNLYPNPLDN